MKKTMLGVVVFSAVLLTASQSEAQLAEITVVEAKLIDGIDGSLVAEGGPWAWGPDGMGFMSGILPGSDLTLQIQCWNEAGRQVYTGELNDITIMPDPFVNLGVLLLFATPDGIAVLVGMSPVPRVVELVPVETQSLSVDVDIKPGSSENPFNVKSKGVLPVIILGAPDLDVESIDVNSLLLAGVAPVSYSIVDMESVADQSVAPDGFNDMLLRFRTVDVLTALGDVTDGQIRDLELIGSLSDGTAITGVDQITVLVKGKTNGAKK